MTYKVAFRNAVTILAAGTFAALFAGSAPAHAEQLQVLGASPPAQDSSPEMAVSKRLVLHDVKVTGSEIAPASRPVLDYAVQMLRQYPATLVYISGQGDPAAVRRQARAVAQYLEQRGIAANRLVLQDATPSDHGVSKTPANAGVVVLNLSGPGCASCPS
jgi:outer membrane protein OmpA-like peptidoglycan-associated protein